jgi:FMN-dependent NADH-azoreductase
MATILVLESSLSGEASVSRLLIEKTVVQLRRTHPDAKIVRRDLAADPIPHLAPDTVAGVRAEPRTPAEHAARRLSDELVAELKAATVVVIGAPMYNFSIPSTLRTWFDHVLRPRVTFAYVDGAPKGLIDDKPVIVIEARGGLYSEGPGMVEDFQEPYLRRLLAFMGLTDLRFVRAEKVGYGPEAREAAIGQALAAIASLEPRAPLAA